MYHGLITRLNIELKRLENVIKNMSEDEVEKQILDYLKVYSELLLMLGKNMTCQT